MIWYEDECRVKNSTKDAIHHVYDGENKDFFPPLFTLSDGGNSQCHAAMHSWHMADAWWMDWTYVVCASHAGSRTAPTATLQCSDTHTMILHGAVRLVHFLRLSPSVLALKSPTFIETVVFYWCIIPYYLSFTFINLFISYISYLTVVIWQIWENFIQSCPAVYISRKSGLSESPREPVRSKTAGEVWWY
jgi:hypothetical protein